MYKEITSILNTHKKLIFLIASALSIIFLHLFDLPNIIIFLVICLNIFIYSEDKLISKEVKGHGTGLLFFTCIIYFTILLILPNFTINDHNFINNAISIFPIGCSIYFCNEYWKAMKKDVEDEGKVDDSIYPTLMVAQGTFYTFVGVSAILFTYDTSHNDISAMLSGLKLAFITSVIGLIYSIAAKNYLKQAGDKYDKKQKQAQNLPTNLSEFDFYRILNNINKNLEKIPLTIEKTTSAINEQNTVLEKTFSETITQSNDALTKNMEQVTNKILLSVENLFSYIAASSNEINENLKTSAKQCQALNNHLQNVSKSVYSLYGMNTALENIKNNIIGMSNHSSNLQTSVNTISKELTNISTLCTDFNKISTDLFEPVNSILVSINKVNINSKELQVNSNEIKNTFGELALSSAEFTKNYKNTIQTMQDISNWLKPYQEYISNDNMAEKICHLSTQIGNLNGSLKGYVPAAEQQLQSIKEIYTLLNTIGKSASEFDKVIEYNSSAITDQFKRLADNLIEENNRYNGLIMEKNTDTMIEAQKKYCENLQGQLDDIINIVADVLKRVQQKYTTDIDNLNKKIDLATEQQEDSRRLN